MKKGMKILGVALGAAVLITGAISATAMADAEDDAATTCPVCGEEYGDGGYGRGGYGFGESTMDVVAELTGLTAEEIHDLRDEGLSLAEIAENNGVTTDELIAAIVAEKTVEYQARVAEGTMTREQAAYMQQNMEQRTLEMVTRTTTGPAEWRGGGMMNGSGFGAAGERGSRGGGMMGGRGAFGSNGGACFGDGEGPAAGSASRWGGNSR